MAIAKWATPLAQSGNIASTSLNSIVTGSESAVVTYNNATSRDLYGAITLKLGSISPSVGGSVMLRVTCSDGVNVADRVGGDVYTFPVTTGGSAKVVIFPMVRLYPLSLRFSIVNNTGVSFSSSGNELYVTPYNEDVT